MSASDPFPHHDDTVGVRELRQNLSIYLGRIQQGEHLVVTDRGVPVAQLVPLPQPGGVIASLVRQGLARPPKRSGGVANMGPPLPQPGPRVSELLIEARRQDGR